MYYLAVVDMSRRLLLTCALLVFPMAYQVCGNRGGRGVPVRLCGAPGGRRVKVRRCKNGGTAGAGQGAAMRERRDGEAGQGASRVGHDARVFSLTPPLTPRSLCSPASQPAAHGAVCLRRVRLHPQRNGGVRGVGVGGGRGLTTPNHGRRLPRTL